MLNNIDDDKINEANQKKSDYYLDPENKGTDLIKPDQTEPDPTEQKTEQKKDDKIKFGINAGFGIEFGYKFNKHFSGSIGSNIFIHKLVLIPLKFKHTHTVGLELGVIIW